jgi:flavin reductase (DIM6/NTAB) family NADH-FMN oxidoreductase RutF
MFLDPTVPGAIRPTMFPSLVTPRPIGWISTVDAQGRANLAPYSFFNLASSTPPMLMLSINVAPDRDQKDTLANIRSQGEFVYNLATVPLAQQMSDSSVTAPFGVDEFEMVGLAKAPCLKVRPPRVALSPMAMECVVERIVDIEPREVGDTLTTVVFGRVVGLHIDDAMLDAKGRFNSAAARPLARLGGFQYAEMLETFELARPGPYPGSS